MEFEEGFYLLRHPNEDKPVLAHGYFCSDMGGEFVFGFNTHDGGGLISLKHVSEKTKIERVNLVPTEPTSDMTDAGWMINPDRYYVDDMRPIFKAMVAAFEVNK